MAAAVEEMLVATTAVVAADVRFIRATLDPTEVVAVEAAVAVMEVVVTAVAAVVEEAATTTTSRKS